MAEESGVAPVSGNDYNRRMTGFTKLFAGIVDSTVWREAMHVKVVWVTMLAKADRNGVVSASLPGLADAARVSIEECEEALARLKAPDKYSRTKLYEGRRVEECDGGWLLLNHGKYRKLQIEDERRIAVREAVARHRQKKADEKVITSDDRNQGKPTVSGGHQRKPIAEAEADTEAEAGKIPRSARGDVDKPAKPTWLTPYENLWREHFSAALPFGQAAKVLKPLEAEHGSPAVLRALGNYLAAHAGERSAFVSLPKFAATFGQWLNPTRPKSRQDRNFEAIDLGLPDEEEAL